VTTSIFEKWTQGWVNRHKVKLLEIRALGVGAWWVSREEHICSSNYIGLDIYFNSLWHICIPTSGLSACGCFHVFWLSLFVQAKVNCPTNLGRNEYQISLADRIWEMRCIILPNLVKICQSIAELLQFFFISQDGSSSQVGLLKFSIFIGRCNLEVEMHHCAKFCQNWSNAFWDITIFYSSRWRPPPSVI